jgi:hypothetical protein
MSYLNLEYLSFNKFSLNLYFYKISEIDDYVHIQIEDINNIEILVNNSSFFVINIKEYNLILECFVMINKILYIKIYENLIVISIFKCQYNVLLNEYIDNICYNH